MMDQSRTNTKGEKKRLSPRRGEDSLESSPEKAVHSSPTLQTGRKASPAKLVVVVTLALGLIGYHNFPQLQAVSSIVSELSSLSTSLSSKLWAASSSVDVGSVFKELPRTYALCSHPGDGKKIYTVDANNSVVECVGVSGERIISAGNLNKVQAMLQDHAIAVGAASDTNKLHIRHIPKGAAVLPGLSDSHCHTLEYGASQLIPMSEAKSVKETIQVIRQYIESDEELLRNKDKVIEGWGWDHASWDVPKMPSWEDFESDPITSGRRFILEGRDGHAIWTSRRTLEDNGPLPEGDIDGGVIFRDEDGNPTGIFMDSAQDLIARPKLTDADLAKRFRTTVNDALKHGLTTLHDAGFRPESYGFFERTAKKSVLPIRIYGMTYFDEYGQYWGDSDVPYSADLSKDGNKERLSRRSVKIFADGALRTGGAALYEPYNDNPSSSGALRISPEKLQEVIPRFLKDGWQVNVHAIGDRANGIVLDALSYALRANGVNVTALRPRIEHAQIMTRPDMKRLGELGVIASIQPTHAISDMWFAEDRLGPERVKGLYAFRHILDSGARITLGSDFPVEEINPLKGFYAAITRVEVDGTSPHGPGGWFPDQRLTRLEALRGMTIDPAYASFSEEYLGSLEPGKRADWVVVSADIMDPLLAPVEIVKSVKVLATAIDGRAVYVKEGV